jgi:hypothetical protein
VVSCCECGDDPSVSCATNLVSQLVTTNFPSFPNVSGLNKHMLSVPTLCVILYPLIKLCNSVSVLLISLCSFSWAEQL